MFTRSARAAGDIQFLDRIELISASCFAVGVLSPGKICLLSTIFRGVRYLSPPAMGGRFSMRRMSLTDTLSCRLRSVAFPAQRLKIGIVISTAMSFWDDVVNAGRFLRYLLPAMILTQVLITL